MSRTIGPNQLEALRLLASRGMYPGGWIWDNHSTTVRLLNSLVCRGFVETFDLPYETANGTDLRRYYKITPQGRMVVNMLKTKRS